MPLSVVVRLRDGRYEAARPRRQEAEWPPVPARVFCALVASAQEEADWAALEWLEQQDPPQVLASPTEAGVETFRSGFVVTNETREGGGNQTHPGRTNNVRERAGVIPGVDEFAFVWPEADANDAVLARLMRLAHRVPYVGRSTSSAEVSVHPGQVTVRPEWVTWAANEDGDRDGQELAVPYTGYVKALCEVYDAGMRRAWEVAETATYRRTDVSVTEPAVPVSAGPFRDFVVLRFSGGGVPLAGDAGLQVAENLRKAVMSRLPDPIPAQVSGHGAGDRAHVAYLALPFVGHAKADGHLLGCAVAIPEMETAERRMLLKVLLELDTIPWRRDRKLDVEYAPDAPEWTLTPERWTAEPRGKRTWVSATPVMLDRIPKRDQTLADIIAASLMRAGYPEPAAVEMLAGSAVPGGIWHVPRLNGPARQPRPLKHCRVTFPSPVTGPVLAGALRYRGIGLFVPEPHRS